MINLYNMDCMEAMKDMADNQYDLAIVDPPYGISRFGNRIDKTLKINKWDTKPTKEYFNELFRISNNQIIWGANNFDLPTSEYFCVWDKKQTVDNFASAEYAFVSMGLKKPAKVFRYSIHKVIQDRKSENGKIHPTQKPVKLYEWLLMNYAKEGDKILDTHLGSGSIAIACHNLGYDLDAYEIDKEYYKATLKRFNNHTVQLRLL